MIAAQYPSQFSSALYFCSILHLTTALRQGSLQRLRFAWTNFLADKSANTGGAMSLVNGLKVMLRPMANHNWWQIVEGMPNSLKSKEVTTTPSWRNFCSELTVRHCDIKGIHKMTLPQYFNCECITSSQCCYNVTVLGGHPHDPLNLCLWWVKVIQFHSCPHWRRWFQLHSSDCRVWSSEPACDYSRRPPDWKKRASLA